MRLLVDIPNGLYANLGKIQNGSIAAKRILQCVREGEKAEQRTGHWVEQQGDLSKWYMCEDCGQSMDCKSRYCLNCGRK